MAGAEVTYAQRGAHASHARERDRLIRRCFCAKLFETRFNEPSSLCPKCVSEQSARRAHELLIAKNEAEEYRQRKWDVEHDPGPAPFRKGARLTDADVEHGLELGAFSEGMIFHKRNGRRYIVADGKLRQCPPV